jgi:TRAP-type C4-dicarboxylate transport system permease small subunit
MTTSVAREPADRVDTSPVKVLRAVSSRVHQGVRIAGDFAGLCILGTAAVLCYQVVARNLVSANTDWVYQFAGYLNSWAALIGISYALLHRKHIVSGGIMRRLGEIRAISYVVETARCCVFGGVAGVLLYNSMQLIEQQRAFNVLPPSGLAIPTWIVDLALPIGSALVILEVAAQLIDLAVDGPPPLEEPRST